MLVLIALLTSLATPALSGFARRAALDDTAASLLALTQQAQSLAAHDAITYRVVIDHDLRTAWLDYLGGEGYQQDTIAGVEPVTWGRSVNIISDLPQDGMASWGIIFQPTGLVTPGNIVMQQDDHLVALTCGAATERYRLVKTAELQGENAEGVLDALRR